MAWSVWLIELLPALHTEQDVLHWLPFRYYHYYYYSSSLLSHWSKLYWDADGAQRAALIHSRLHLCQSHCLTREDEISLPQTMRMPCSSTKFKLPCIFRALPPEKLSPPETVTNFASLTLTHRNLLSTILVGKGRQNWNFKENWEGARYFWSSPRQG